MAYDTPQFYTDQRRGQTPTKESANDTHAKHAQQG
jgi:hypothetical protein